MTTADLSLALAFRDVLVEAGEQDIVLSVADSPTRVRTQTTIMRTELARFVRELKQRIARIDTRATTVGVTEDERQLCLRYCMALANVDFVPQCKSLPMFLTLYTVYTENEEDGTSTFNKDLMDRYTAMLGTAREWYEVKETTVDSSQVQLDETRVLRAQAVQWVRWIQESARDTIAEESLADNWILPDEGLTTADDYLQLWQVALEAYIVPDSTLAYA